MDKMEKKEAIDKILRELEDLKNSETSVLKKVAQIEADNINLGLGILDKSLPDLHENADKSIEAIDSLLVSFTEHRDKFVKDNNLEPADETETS
ncbi:hypothetical protein ABDK00_000615 [Niabella insulamsoli]|uniref:hypothetical protein n=1 Tax=Niabella insulamsoli TaxID=3144874 RepID=UPI0031FCFAE8